MRSPADPRALPARFHRRDWTMLLRMGVLGLLAVLAAVEPTASPSLPEEGTAHWSPWSWVALVYGFSILLAWWWDRGRHPSQSGWIQLGVDTMLAACVVQMSGGIRSDFSLLYLVAITGSATHGNPRQTWASFGACAITYSSLGLFELLDWVELAGQQDPSVSPQAKLLTMARNLGAMVAITLFTHRLTSLWQVAEQARADAERQQALGSSKILQLQRDLAQSERMAAIGQLAASVAHEIRNPLAAMSGCVELLALPLDPKEDARLREIIRREITRLDATVEQLLDFARPQTPAKARHDLAEVVREVIEAFSQDPQRSAIRIRYRGKEQLDLEFERQSIAQILWNLLLNAAQAQDNRGQIEIALEEDEREVRLCVLDQGCGIAVKDRERIFEPYYTTKSEGSGFGLAVVAKIVERHQGHIEILPQERGSCFVISLPKEASLEKTQQQAA